VSEKLPVSAACDTHDTAVITSLMLAGHRNEGLNVLKFLAFRELTAVLNYRCIYKIRVMFSEIHKP
jgi:hypothetical protein